MFKMFVYRWRSFVRSISGQIFFLFFIGMIIPVAVGGFMSHRQSTAIVQDQVGNVAALTVTQVSDKLNLIIKKLEDTSMFILGNQVILEALEADYPSDKPLDYFNLNRQAQELLYSLLVAELLDIYIFDQNRQNNIFSSTANITGHWDEGWYHEIVAADGKPVWYGLTDRSYLRRTNFGLPVFGLGRAIKSQTSGKIIGVLFIEVRGTHLIQELQNVKFGETGYTFVVDQNNNYMYHPYSGLYGKPSTFDFTANRHIFNGNGSDLLVIPKRLSNGWYATGVVPIEELDAKSKEIRKLTLIIMACSAIYALIIGMIVTTKVARPLVHLNRLMRRGAAGDLNVRSRFLGTNEIGQLGRSFDQMLEQIRLLIIQRESEENEKKKAEIRAMRYQINPHFLYNTLNTIRHLARFKRIDDVTRSITNLIPLLEASIERNGTFVLLGEEFDLLQKYMVIQQYRYNDKTLQLEIYCPEDLRNTEIPRMLLQPIVENAIFHGIAPKDGSGLIAITVSRNERDILIQITDDGIGIEPERLPELTQSHSSKLRGMTKIGLYHVHQTLALFYGQGYGLEVSSRYGEGTSITLRIASAPPKEEERRAI
jgi:two-component system sensor histidine kinase YesM